MLVRLILIRNKLGLPPSKMQLKPFSREWDLFLIQKFTNCVRYKNNFETVSNENFFKLTKNCKSLNMIKTVKKSYANYSLMKTRLFIKVCEWHLKDLLSKKIPRHLHVSIYFLYQKNSDVTKVYFCLWITINVSGSCQI